MCWPLTDTLKGIAVLWIGGGGLVWTVVVVVAYEKLRPQTPQLDGGQLFARLIFWPLVILIVGEILLLLLWSMAVSEAARNNLLSLCL